MKFDAGSKITTPSIGRIATRVIVFGLLQKLIGVAVILTTTQNGVHHEPATSSDLHMWGIVFFGLFAAILSPVVETIVLQALPLEAMRNKRVPQPLAILASALLFGFWHVREGPAKVMSTFAVGLMLGFIYERYRHEKKIRKVAAVNADQSSKSGFSAAVKGQDLFSRISLSGFIHVALTHSISNTIALAFILASINSTT